MPEEPSENHIGLSATETTSETTEVDYSRAQRTVMYVNHVNAVTNVFEVRLNLGSAIGIDPATNKLIVEQLTSIYMSPEMAKVLQLTLTSALDRYEDKFGKLRFPPPASQASSKES